MVNVGAVSMCKDAVDTAGGFDCESSCTECVSINRLPALLTLNSDTGNVGKGVRLGSVEQRVERGQGEGD